MPRAKKAETVPVSILEQEETMYVVSIDDTFFLAYAGDEWIGRLLYAKRFTRPHEANAWVLKLSEQHPNRKVQVRRLWVGFVVSEAV